MQVSVAVHADLDELVRLESQLFRDDAGVHDPQVDVSWPTRHGRDDFARLIDLDSALVLVARRESVVAGHLVGYVTAPSATRFGRRTAEIRSLYVDSASRAGGVGQALVGRFKAWARANDATSISVTSYVANHGARAFYARLGFAERSVVFQAVLED
ncbi:GNAT family N-acetyltransferase [Kribbella pittospori]|uniref:GNAT family N-acetyltransferase n=1 Tax=Kribbella pittospori TaxID=722689 RepID=A0A4R0JJU8_9ACTN|nr:GNAT family N-acetyltransferase [Kribbella pittospori]TCC47383.1 GNAT family N-acetyltransferase [Kribbella pittospori]